MNIIKTVIFTIPLLVFTEIEASEQGVTIFPSWEGDLNGGPKRKLREDCGESVKRFKMGGMNTESMEEEDPVTDRRTSNWTMEEEDLVTETESRFLIMEEEDSVTDMRTSNWTMEEGVSTTETEPKNLEMIEKALKKLYPEILTQLVNLQNELPSLKKEKLVPNNNSFPQSIEEISQNVDELIVNMQNLFKSDVLKDWNEKFEVMKGKLNELFPKLNTLFFDNNRYQTITNKFINKLSENIKEMKKYIIYIISGK